MKIVKTYIFLLTIILVFTSTLLAENMRICEEGAVEIKPLITNYNSKQILYSLLVIEIATDNVKELGLSKIEVSQGNEEGNLNLIYQDEYMQIIKDNWEFVFNKNEKESKSMVISSPQIVVVPGHTGNLSVGQEEILFDYSGNEKIFTLENTFKLEITPERAFRSEQILTRIKMNTGAGETGLETEAWISPDSPQLLGIVTSSEEGKADGLIQMSKKSKKRYFALYLTAQPTEIIALPAFTGSLYGLDRLFEAKKNNIYEKYIGVSLWNSDNDKKDKEVNISGVFQNTPDKKLNFTYNQILSGESSIGVIGQLNDGLWLGGELIYGDGDGLSTAVEIVDSVKLGPIRFAVGISPIVYNFDREERSSRYFLSSETSLNEDLKLTIGYHFKSKSNYTKISMDYQLNASNSLLMGYMYGSNEEYDNKDEKGYWLGLRFKL